LEDEPPPPSPDDDGRVSLVGDAVGDAPPPSEPAEEPLDELLEVLLEEPLDELPDDSFDAFAAFAAALVEAEPPRSFLAQPDPLKWIAGEENSLRIVPDAPHEGQNPGPGSLIPRRMSARWSQAVQMYS
jgi:hypothetical protein